MSDTCEAWRHPVLEWSYRCKRCGMQVGSPSSAPEAECACKCHESHPRLHCLKCAPSSDPVGEAFGVDADTRAAWDAPAPRDEPTRAALLPDLTEMWARVFEEGVK